MKIKLLYSLLFVFSCGFLFSQVPEPFDLPLYSRPPIFYPENLNPEHPQLDQSLIHLIILGDGYKVYDGMEPTSPDDAGWLVDENNQEGLKVFHEFDNSNQEEDGTLAEYPDQPVHQNDLRDGDANDLIDYIFGNDTRVGFEGLSPFKEYKDYFRVYRVLYNSSEDKPTHPGGAECEGIGSPIIPNNSSIPFWGSSYDFCDIHRALSCDFGKVDEFLDTFFPTLTNTYPNNSNVFVIVLSKSNEYSGAANIKRRIATVASQYSTDGNFNSFNLGFPVYNLEDERAGAHEFAHIFAALQDEYFVPYEDVEGNCFDNAEELNLDKAEFYTAPNRFFFPEGQTISGIFPYFDPIGDNNLPWNHWSGVTGLPVTIANFPMVAFQEVPPCTNNQGATFSEVRKPSNSSQATNVTNNVTSCFMRNLHGPFCAVCREAIIERIHDLVSPVNSFSPSNEDPIIGSSSIVFDLELTVPNPNTVRVIWEMENSEGEVMNLETDYNNATDANGNAGAGGGAPGGYYRWHLECARFEEEGFNTAGEYTVRARIFDMTANSEGASNRWVRHPKHEIDVDDETNGNHEEIVEWTVNYSGIPGTDLFTEDLPDDNGLEPSNPTDGNLWISEDIWVRNDANDGVLIHENPVYNGPNSSVQVNVWVSNKGCKAFNPAIDNGSISLHWAKASTSLEWPQSWDGVGVFQPGLPQGGLIANIPLNQVVDINSGKKRFSSNWTLPLLAPYNTYFGGVDYTHFCLLSYINASTDAYSMISTGAYPLYTNVKNSNNVAWKNFTINDKFDGIVGQTSSIDVIKGASVIVGNPSNQTRNIKLTFNVPSNESGKPITEEAELRITLSDQLWSLWANGGYAGTNVSIVNSGLHQIKLNAPQASITNINLSANEHYGMYVSANFLTQQRSSKEIFTLHVTQLLNDGSNTILGGETYVYKPNPYRFNFTADAGADKEILIGTTEDQKATTLSEMAVYNWYNSNGSLLHTGATMSLSPTTTSSETYKLEIIATSDGYKDYDEVTVTAILGKITSVIPNPINAGTLSIGYKVSTSVSVPKIRVVNISTSAFTEHSISTGTGTLSLDISPFVAGSYKVVLICDGTLADDELLIVQ